MTDIKGPHHSHPNGEIDMIMPIIRKPSLTEPAGAGKFAVLGRPIIPLSEVERH